MEKRSIINLENVSLSFNERVLFDRINLTIFQGEIFMLVGDNGSGLTTFLRLISGLIKPLEGTVKVFNINIHNVPQQQLIKVRQKTGFIFQHGALLNNMTLIDNIALPLRYHTNFKENEINEIARENLRFVGIEKYSAKLPSQLNEECLKKGGLARALALKPRLILCDELTAGFGEYYSNAIFSPIKKLTKKKGITPVIVSHNKIIYNNMVDRVGVLKNGRIEMI